MMSLEHWDILIISWRRGVMRHENAGYGLKDQGILYFII